METKLRNPVEDAELTRALVDVMNRLRNHQYGDVLGVLEDALQGSGDAFVDTLARHLLYEEQILFPDFHQAHPESAEDVRALQAEHAHLRRLAAELAKAIKSGEVKRAYRLARAFLAELYAHIDHEAKVTGSAETTSP